jgi:hypothetical protein
MFLPHLQTKPQPATEPATSAAVQATKPGTGSERVGISAGNRSPGNALALQFKTKLQTIEFCDGTPKREFYNVPAFTRNHCQNLQAFRTSKRFGAYANSDFFPGILRGAVRALGIGSRLYLNAVPDTVTINNRGFLAVVTIELSET